MKTARFAVVAVAFAAGGSGAQEIAHTLGRIDPYLLEERVEVALAASAAPAHVSAAATVLVLHRDGYRALREGTNGFTCLVERSWSSPIGPHRDFFNPRLRAPICYNREASGTILGDYLRRTELALAGRSIAEIKRTIETEIGTGTLLAPRGLAMSYMLSAGQVLGSQAGQYKPHVMVYIPYATDAELGDNPATSDHPVIFEHAGGPLAAIVIPVKAFNPVGETAPAPRH